MVDRIPRLNSLLKEVLSEVIRREVKDPSLKEVPTVIRVDVSKDIRHAKVYVSSLGSEEEKKKLLQILSKAAEFIAIRASKKVVLRYFPTLTFKLDDSIDKHLRIEELLRKIEDERPSLPES